MTKQLKTRQICLFFIAFLPVSKLFLLPSVIAGFAKEDLWLCTLTNLFLDLVTVGVVLTVCKKTRLTFRELLENAFGVGGAKVVFGIYFLYFFLKCFVPIQEQEEFVKLTLYVTMPTDLYFLPFFIATFYLALKPLKTLGRVADILWVFTLAGYLLLFGLSVSNPDYSALMPVGARGINSVLKGSYASFNYFGDCVYLLFFIGEFAYKKGDFAKITLSYLASGLLVVLFMMTFWGAFTSLAFRQTFALTEISKYTTVVNNTGRFDYLGILLILFSCIFSLSLPVYFACYTLKYIINPKKEWIIPLVITLFLVFFTLISNQYTYSILRIFSKYINGFFLLCSNLLPILSILLIKRRTKVEVSKT